MGSKSGKKTRVDLAVILVSLITTIGLLNLWGVSVGRSYLLFLVSFLFVVFLIKNALKRKNKRRIKYAAIYSVPFSIAFWFGHKIAYQSIIIEPFYPEDLLSIFAMMVLTISLIVNLFYYIDRSGLAVRKKGRIEKRGWVFYSLAIFVAWVPFFLVFFPGQISVDSAVMISQVLGERDWSNWHPVLYVVFLSAPIKLGFYVLGSLTAGIALATLAQMIILAVVFGYVVSWCRKKISRRWVWLAYLGFFAFCPIVLCYSITLWKDVLFAAVFLLLVIKLYDFIVLHGRGDKIEVKEIISSVLLVILLAFLRNGGVLVLAVLGLALFIYYRMARRMIGIMFVLALCFVFLVQGPVYNLLGINKTPFMESMSIPAQQIAYLAYTDVLSEEERANLLNIADVEKLKERYLPMNADPAKQSFDYDKVEEDKSYFLLNWWELLTIHLPAYVKAFLLQTSSYWYIGGYSMALSYEHNHEDLWLHEDYEDMSLLGEGAREDVARNSHDLMETSWFGWMGNVGVVVWLTVLTAVIFLYQKRINMMIVMACPIMYIFSLVIASPVSNSFRYVYALLLMLPVLILVCFMKEDKKKYGKIEK